MLELKIVSSALERKLTSPELINFQRRQRRSDVVKRHSSAFLAGRVLACSNGLGITKRRFRSCRMFDASGKFDVWQRHTQVGRWVGGWWCVRENFNAKCLRAQIPRKSLDRRINIQRERTIRGILRSDGSRIWNANSAMCICIVDEKRGKEKESWAGKPFVRHVFRRRKNSAKADDARVDKRRQLNVSPHELKESVKICLSSETFLPDGGVSDIFK